MSDLASLIVRLEAATGPDEALDWDTASFQNMGISEGTPAYTASLDAALTLVPEGWPFQVGRESTENGEEPFAVVNYEAEARAATPALALCIAALKARLP